MSTIHTQYNNAQVKQNDERVSVLMPVREHEFKEDVFGSQQIPKPPTK